MLYNTRLARLVVRHALIWAEQLFQDKISEFACERLQMQALIHPGAPSLPQPMPSQQTVSADMRHAETRTSSQQSSGG